MITVSVAHNWQDLREALLSLQLCLQDAAVIGASPRLRFFAAQDAAVMAAVILSGLRGDDLGGASRDRAVSYLRAHTMGPGLAAHLKHLFRFNRDDYDPMHCFTHAEANSALTSAHRVYTAIRWKIHAIEKDTPASKDHRRA